MPDHIQWKGVAWLLEAALVARARRRSLHWPGSATAGLRPLPHSDSIRFESNRIESNRIDRDSTRLGQTRLEFSRLVLSRLPCISNGKLSGSGVHVRWLVDGCDAAGSNRVSSLAWARFASIRLGLEIERIRLSRLKAVSLVCARRCRGTGARRQPRDAMAGATIACSPPCSVGRLNAYSKEAAQFALHTIDAA